MSRNSYRLLVGGLLFGAFQFVGAVTLTHTFTVKDKQGNPIEGALVKPSSIHASTIDSQKSTYPVCTTDASGVCQIPLVSMFDGKYSVKPYTTISANVSKDGYLPAYVTDTQGGDRPADNGMRVVLIAGQQSVLVKYATADLQGNAINGAKVTIKLPQFSIDVQCVTNSLGICEQRLDYVVSSRSNVKIESTASIAGRYSQNLTREIKFGQEELEILNFTLDQPSDYLCETVKAPSSKALAKQMSEWVDLLRLKALIQDAVITHGNFCTETFKNKRYASVKLNHTSVFNSLKLNPYQIGIKMFDEVIRKMLDVVAPAMGAFPLDGYEIEVNTATGNAVEKYADQKKLSYVFYMPKKSVKSYKEKDITGQQLIDSSVVLLNDERIDLKLQ